jgi:glycine/D-amino acid oxidase-like deaminating enzyme
VVLVGPDEPEDFLRHDGVFGSHYDEGRITRTFDPGAKFWRNANRASIARYGEISAKSGVDFYREVGTLHVGPEENSNVALVAKICEEDKIYVEAFSDAKLAERFPFLKQTARIQGNFEPRNAGYISPRRLVQAQTIAAERAGVRIINDYASGISENRDAVTILTHSENVDVERVLVAAGGHTEPLLSVALGFTVFARTVAMFRLGKGEAERLSEMPSMRCIDPQRQSPYILPPIAYPDGHSWLKLGGDPADIVLKGDADIKRWFKSGGSTEAANHLQETIMDLIRDLKFEERRVVPCMTTFGKGGLPSIGPLSERVAVAAAMLRQEREMFERIGPAGCRSATR